MSAENAIVKYLFHKDGIKDVDVSELEKLLKKFPYSTHLHWLKAAKHKDDEALLQQTGLYVYYPGRFNFFLNSLEEEKKGNGIVSNADTGAPKPLLQPLFTKDYFAYTQTKLPEKIENDRPPTMEQVKSFTGWLKMMRQPRAAEDIDNEPEITENEPPLSGEEVLKKEEVITESMAEIWVQHGKKEEAVRIYEKLILINPEKKGYFAAKISALKEQ